MAKIKKERYEDSEQYQIRHSAAHVMAQAMLEMFEHGESKIAIGPPGASSPWRPTRSTADMGLERMKAKIRAAQKMQVPYMLVVGDREVEERTVSLRRREGERVNGMEVSAFMNLVAKRIKTRSLTL